MNQPGLEGIDVLGSNLSNVLNAFGSFQMLASRIMSEEQLGQLNAEGLVLFDPDKWYPVTRWLATLRRVGKEYGDKMLMDAGLAVPKNAVFPPFVKDIDSALQSIDVAYHMNHASNGEPMFNPATGKMAEGIGHYGYQRVQGQKKIIAEVTAPYPCPFDNGLILSMARRFEKTANVSHDASKPCRNKGGQSCTYVITWA